MNSPMHFQSGWLQKELVAEKQFKDYPLYKLVFNTQQRTPWQFSVADPDTYQSGSGSTDPGKNLNPDPNPDPGKNTKIF